MTASNSTARVFDDKPAVREATPLLLGLIGPSGSGKTYSALRLATGIQRISGGDIFVIDTESRRALHYAEKFKFRHVQFGAPFGSLDYLAAIDHCIKKGAKTIIVDSMSHEHEGPGGVLEQHAAETKRLAAAWRVSEEKAQMSAWGPCKADRRRMINTILQFNANFIFCFRAKEKLKIVSGKPPENLGFMPIAGEEFVFEMVAKCLLLPGASGVPTWESNWAGERMMMKMPEQFKQLFATRKALDEDTGQEMALWAAGVAPSSEAVALLAQYETAKDKGAWDAAEKARALVWKQLPVADKARVKSASDDRLQRIAAGETTPAAAGSTKVDSPPSIEEAIQQLREAGDLDVLKSTWDSIAAAYKTAAVELPVDIEAVYGERRESFL
jgi:ABC-type dipeptide/oligopeptide/nickel transport system ATPase subunit